jgi:UDP-N-acetylglucosamine 2-epimerase (non-hydrolysing)
MHILHVVGARPNFMKAAPVLRAVSQTAIRQTLVHTGQHYDANMSDIFFQQLGIPKPDVNLAVGSDTHARQTAQVMMGLEAVVLERRPDAVLVYGDVNSTVAAALVCAKLLVRVAHVEAGLRSFDRSMPEEINRLVTDQLSDFLFTPSADGDANLMREGIPSERIHLVGNVMIDTLIRLLPHAIETKKNGVPPQYALVTLHRPANVDDSDVLHRINGIRLCDPVSYLECLALQRRATVVLTDSGGIQEETTYLGIPCLTLRPNTERPITIEVGTNVLIGNDIPKLQAEVGKILNGGAKKGTVPPLWDGHAGERIAGVLEKSL